MAATPRGHIERLPSGSYRVHVYGGTDPVTGKPRRIRVTGPDDATAAAALDRLLGEVDEERFPNRDAQALPALRPQRGRNAATRPAEPVHLWGAVREDRTPP